VNCGWCQAPIRSAGHDVIAHARRRAWTWRTQIITRDDGMRYLALSTIVHVEACEYPDSREILVGDRTKAGERGLRRMSAPRSRSTTIGPWKNGGPTTVTANPRAMRMPAGVASPRGFRRLCTLRPTRTTPLRCVKPTRRRKVERTKSSSEAWSYGQERAALVERTWRSSRTARAGLRASSPRGEGFHRERYLAAIGA